MIRTRITQLESILTNQLAEHTPEELADFEEELFELQHVEDLWKAFGEIPMNPETECLDTSWHGFPAGTFREDIWHWFEHYFDISIAEDLMFQKIK